MNIRVPLTAIVSLLSFALPAGAQQPAGVRVDALIKQCWASSDPAVALVAATEALTVAAGAKDVQRHARALS